MNDKYNGWKNYATWNLVLWVDNDWLSYQVKVGMLESKTEIVVDNDVIRLARELFPDGNTPDTQGNNWEGGRWEDIDWQEIAGSWEEERQEMLEYQ